MGKVYGLRVWGFRVKVSGFTVWSLVVYCLVGFFSEHEDLG